MNQRPILIHCHQVKGLLTLRGFNSSNAADLHARAKDRKGLVEAYSSSAWLTAMETTEESSSSSELESDSSNSDYEDKDNSQSITIKTLAAAPTRTFENPISFAEHCVHVSPAAATSI